MNPYSVWAEIDLSAIAENIRQLRSVLAPGSRLMAVVKANAYGHGAAEVSARVLSAGADALGVARIGEAVRIRHAGIDVPILIFGCTQPELTQKLIHYDLAQTVSSYSAAAALSARAVSSGRSLKIHIKIDTGMGRLGVLPGEMGLWSDAPDIDGAVREICDICRLPGLDPEGIYTHFATADDREKTLSRAQFRLFTEILDRLRLKGVEFAVRHAANSAAIIDLPETHLDMARAGISIYGHYPSGQVAQDRVRLTPAMTFKSRVVHVKKVGSGFKVSYGWIGQTRGPTTIATVSVGYADGLSRLLSGRGRMLVRGTVAPIIGRVCMDHTMLDVGHIPDVAPFDEVVIFGRQGDAVIPVEDVAAATDTINYEVLSVVSDRVQRVYLRGSV